MGALGWCFAPAEIDIYKNHELSWVMRMRYNMTCNQSCDVLEKNSVMLDRKAICHLVWLEMWYCAIHLCWAAFTTTHVKHAPLDPRSFLQVKCHFESFSWQKNPKSDVPSCLEVPSCWYFKNFDFQLYDACVFVQARPCCLRQWSCSKTVFNVDIVDSPTWNQRLQKSPYMLRSKSVSRFEMQENY